MIIDTKIKDYLQMELTQAKEIWIASAIISDSGWSFIQKELPENAIQNYLIGIDLSTPPSVFKSILNNLEINARVFKNDFTFHPKVYIIKKTNEFLTAFIGSSNTTSWGLEKNVEMNFQTIDQEECKKLLNWFNIHFDLGYLITKNFLDKYSAKFKKAKIINNEVETKVKTIKKELSKDEGQFFNRNHHEIFKEEYHEISTASINKIRLEVKNKLILLHEDIYPKFKTYKIYDLHHHSHKQDIVSKHYLSFYNSYCVNAMWLHYGKSKPHLNSYSHPHDKSFINNARIQVIMHENSVGIWLVLGKDWGSQIDRDFFKSRMQKTTVQNKFFSALKKLDETYWIDYKGYQKRVWVKEIESISALYNIIEKENIEYYFIIGCEIDWLDARLSSNNISKTILIEFKKLYPLYEIMRHK